jgi:hypothetical protein
MGSSDQDLGPGDRARQHEEAQLTGTASAAHPHCLLSASISSLYFHLPSFVRTVCNVDRQMMWFSPIAIPSSFLLLWPLQWHSISSTLDLPCIVLVLMCVVHETNKFFNKR